MFLDHYLQPGSEGIHIGLKSAGAVSLASWGKIALLVTVWIVKDLLLLFPSTMFPTDNMHNLCGLTMRKVLGLRRGDLPGRSLGVCFHLLSFLPVPQKLLLRNSFALTDQMKHRWKLHHY